MQPRTARRRWSLVNIVPSSWRVTSGMFLQVFFILFQLWPLYRNRLQSMEKFRNGEIDMDNLCSELRAKARCSETGALVDEEDFDKIMSRENVRTMWWDCKDFEYCSSYWYSIILLEIGRQYPCGGFEKWGKLYEIGRMTIQELNTECDGSCILGCSMGIGISMLLSHHNLIARPLVSTVYRTDWVDSLT